MKIKMMMNLLDKLELAKTKMVGVKIELDHQEKQINAKKKELRAEKDKPEQNDDRIALLEHEIRALEDSYFKGKENSTILM